MANLHVQPKKRNAAWIWILVILLLIVAAVFYYFNYYKKGVTPGSGNTLNEQPIKPAHSPLAWHFALKNTLT